MNIISEKKNNTNRDRASNNSSSNVEVSYESTIKMFLKIPRNKHNGYVNCKTIKEAAPMVIPLGIQYHQTRIHITSEEISIAPEAESTAANYTTLATSTKQKQILSKEEKRKSGIDLIPNDSILTGVREKNF